MGLASLFLETFCYICFHLLLIFVSFCLKVNSKSQCNLTTLYINRALLAVTIKKSQQIKPSKREPKPQTQNIKHQKRQINR